jgi:adenylate cyclase
MIAIASSFRTGWFDQLEAHTYDYLFLLRGSVATPKDVVVVAIDEPSFGVIGKQWPWPRNLHAQLIEGLFQRGAKTVATDIVFAERSKPSEDRSLVDVIRRHPSLIIAAGIDQVDREYFTQQIQVLPIKEFIQHSDSFGINILPVDKDGFVRQTCLEYPPYFSFAHVAVVSYQNKKPMSEDNRANHHQRKMNINYYGPPGSIKTVSYYQALHPERYLPDDLFKGKLVFIGFSLQNLPLVTEKQPDHYFVPYSRHIGKTMAGVEIHASIAANLIQNFSIRPFPSQYVISVMITVWGILFLATLGTRLAVQCMVFISLIVMTIGAGFILFAFFNINLPLVFIVLPMMAGFTSNMGFHYFHLFKERRFIRQAFSAYISPELVKSLLKSPEKLKLGGEFVDATVLQLDIRGFTSLTETLPAEDVVQILNTYLGAFAQVIFKWNGMIDKFIGDGIMAVWGVPVPLTNHADLACSAAMEMLEKVAVLNSRKTTYPDIHIRIGINSGRMIAGNVGAEQ